MDMEYIVVDKDDESIDPVIIGNPNYPDSVDKNLSLSSIGDPEINKAIKKEYKDHPWK